MINATRYHLSFIPALLMCMRALSMESTSQLSAQLPSQTQSQSPSPYTKQKQQIKTDLETAAAILTRDAQDKQKKAELILQQALNSPNIHQISQAYTLLITLYQSRNDIPNQQKHLTAALSSGLLTDICYKQLYTHYKKSGTRASAIAN